ncbi:LysR family transcriptional regulator [Thalassospira marina]|uniref:LysR family transcriptional regulator n=1 Tax=Thalassospira marina TaxID=2048283 RepID=A0ABM6QFN6_9PROT|nr:LysR family transcriptional regulator [Thalassospira marina]AUG55416.1 LysR family transcriptional regulator [Thalassospira marina]
MDRNLFENVQPFLAVAEHLSFTHASAILGVTPTAISQAIRNLEQRHGVLLFQRTTRRVSLTEAGEHLYQALRQSAEEVQNAFACLHDFSTRPTGTLRLTFTPLVMDMLIEPILPTFTKACPDVKLELSVSEGIVDIIADNFDAGIRLGAAIEKDMIAIKLSPELSWAVYGSPAYFQDRSKPQKPEDLLDHLAIHYRFVKSGMLHHWQFTRDKRDFTVAIPGAMTVNDRRSMLALAKRGLGLAYMSHAETHDAVLQGQLEPVLGKFITPEPGLYLYFPERSQSQPKLRAFIDIAVKYCNSPAFTGRFHE